MDPITLAALIAAGGSIIGGLFGSNAADKAAKTQTDASNRAIDLQKATIAQARLDSAPWLAAGNAALAQYMGELGMAMPAMTPAPAPTTTPPPATGGSRKPGTGKWVNGKWVPNAPATPPAAQPAPAAAQPFVSKFAATPGYQFQVDQAEKGAINHLGALGMKNSGAALQALTKLRSGLANQEYSNYLGRLSGLAGVGQNQVNQTNSLAANSALNQGQFMQDAGAARASGYVGAANAWTGAMNNMGNTLGNWASYQQ